MESRAGGTNDGENVGVGVGVGEGKEERREGGEGAIDGEDEGGGGREKVVGAKGWLRKETSCPGFLVSLAAWICSVRVLSSAGSSPSHSFFRCRWL